MLQHKLPLCCTTIVPYKDLPQSVATQVATKCYRWVAPLLVVSYPKCCKIGTASGAVETSTSLQFKIVLGPKSLETVCRQQKAKGRRAQSNPAKGLVDYDYIYSTYCILVFYQQPHARHLPVDFGYSSFILIIIKHDLLALVARQLIIVPP